MAAAAASVPKTCVEVEVLAVDDDSWCIRFIVQADGVAAIFTAYHPEMCPPEDWLCAAAGDDVVLELRQGMGLGEICIDQGVCSFRAAPKDDVDLAVSVPVELVAPKLAAALNQAAADGLLGSEWPFEQLGG